MDEDYNPTIFFGEPWDAPIIDGATQRLTPIGQRCMWCEERIEFGDRGFQRTALEYDEQKKLVGRERFTHAECDLRQVVGSLAHQEHRCRCYGGSDHDTPGLTRREEAKLACRRFFETQGLLVPVFAQDDVAPSPAQPARKPDPGAGRDLRDPQRSGGST